MILKKEIFRDDYILRIYKIVDKMDYELNHLNLDMARKYQQLGVLGVFHFKLSLLDSQVETVMGASFLKTMKEHITVQRAFQECHLELLKLTRKWNSFLQKKVLYEDLETPVYDMIFKNITEEDFQKCVLGKKVGFRSYLVFFKEFLKGLKNDFQLSFPIQTISFPEPTIKESLEQWNLEDEKEENNDFSISESALSYERRKTS